MKIPDKVKIQIICAIFRTSSLYLGRMMDRLMPIAIQNNGNRELKRLQGIANDAQKLDNALMKYQYINDPLNGRLNIMFPTWFTCWTRQGDCDDSMNLLSNILRGQMWVIVKNITNTDAGGHCVFLDNKRNLWSDFRLEETNVTDIRKASKKYISNYKYLIHLGRDLKIKRII
ncbi:MAG: hypothetical protein GY853_13490 [PVC group bacterium]|nr:hypothetical protein [PVC group bacterium]